MRFREEGRKKKEKVRVSMVLLAIPNWVPKQINISDMYVSIHASFYIM